VAIELTELIGDPLYQINLVLWMLQPSTGRPINPILHKAGFRLKFVERQLPLPLELADSLNSRGIGVADPVTPDILAARAEKGFLTVECKRSMFGSRVQEGTGGGQVRQARSLLLQVPGVLASALALMPADVTENHLVYFTRYDGTVDQVEGLHEISEKLHQSSYATVPFGLLGLAVTSTNIFLRTYPPPAAVPNTVTQEVAVQSVVHEMPDAETDPRPLYFLPWMPESEYQSDDYSQKAFGTRILMGAAEIVGPARPPCDVELDLLVLLRKATHGIYDRWQNKHDRRTLRRNATDLLRRQLQQAVHGLPFIPLDPPRHGWKVPLMDDTVRSRILETFARWQQERWDNPLPPSLFDHLEDNE
jgi:hypothetical protein